LECIRASGGNVEIGDEWRGIDWSIDEEYLGKIDEQSLRNDSMDFSRKSNLFEKSGGSGIFKLFDWELQFFKHIPKTGEYQKEYEESIRLLRRIEANKKWQARVKKRSIAYF
jgi:hypothetical protein